MKTINVGIIGFGLSGRVFHFPLIKSHEGYKIVKVLSSRPQEVKTYLPAATIVQELAEILTDDIDLIINCSPNDYHYSYTKAALEANKHVVVEKPFVNNSNEGEELIALAKKKNLILSVFQNRRWDGDFLTIQKLLKEKSLGEVMSFESHFDRVRTAPRTDRWREKAGPGSGIFYDLGAHLLDQALVLFGKPDSVYADLEIQRPGGETNDYFHVILSYGKKRVIVHASSYTELSARFFIQGSKGNYLKHGLDPQEDSLKQGHFANEKDFGVEDASQSGSMTSWQNGEISMRKVISEKGSYLTFYQALFESIIHRDPSKVPVTPESSLEVIKLIELCQRLSDERKIMF